MRTVITYLPVESVTASKLLPLVSLTARTTTPGSTPPVASVTVPPIAASWAKALTGKRKSGRTRNAATMTRRNATYINLPPGETETPKLVLLIPQEGYMGAGSQGARRAPGNPACEDRRFELKRRAEAELHQPRHERDVVVVGGLAVLRISLVGHPRPVVGPVEHVEDLEDPVEGDTLVHGELALQAHVHARQRAQVEAAPRNDRALADERRIGGTHAARRPRRCARREKVGARGRRRPAVVAEDVEATELQRVRQLPDAIEREAIPLHARVVPLLRQRRMQRDRHVAHKAPGGVDRERLRTAGRDRRTLETTVGRQRIRRRRLPVARHPLGERHLHGPIVVLALGQAHRHLVPAEPGIGLPRPIREWVVVARRRVVREID